MKNHIIFFSGGKSSFSVADWVKTRYQEDNVVLYFTDTKWEDDDLYRFINEASDALELPMLTHADGRNPVELMFEKKLVFNSRIGDCSKILKMRVARQFLKKGIEPEVVEWRNKQYLKSEDFVTNATLYFGIGWEEMHREGPIRKNWKPFDVVMPLIDEVIDNNQVLAKYGIREPRLYALGFVHNNCTAMCVKAGMGHHRNLRDKLPDVFNKLMAQEAHLSDCVNAYRYIKSIPDEEITEAHRQELYQELDDAYRDYFYDRAESPKPYVSPTLAQPGGLHQYRKYSFMKRTRKGVVSPFQLRDLDKEVREESEQIDMQDIGGCGCFVDFDERDFAEDDEDSASCKINTN